MPAGLGLASSCVWGGFPQRETKLAEQLGQGADLGTPLAPQHLCPVGGHQPNFPSAGSLSKSCTWIPEVLGNPVQSWVVRDERGADSSAPPGPDQTTQPSRVNHFEVMGFRGLWQAEGANLAGMGRPGRLVPLGFWAVPPLQWRRKPEIWGARVWTWGTESS